MGSQTLEIIRQGVWASLTGGWFYDPHQNVFCNAIHLYLWLFLLCAPFVTYLYFPTTFTTWGVYCITTTFTITMLKIVNMALHVLYDKAQAISDPNLKITIKGSKESGGDDDCGIEMQVLGNDNLPSRTSVEQPINEVSEANSMLSINEHVTSTIDLKVDVHRKNSSESSGSISIYPPGVIKSITSVPTYRAETHYQQQTTSGNQHNNIKKQDNNNQQQQQQVCQNQNDNIRRRYSDNIHQLDKLSKQEIPSQYSVPIFKDAVQQQQQHNNSLNQQQYRQHHHHRNYSQGHELFAELWRGAPLSKQESLTSITQENPEQQNYKNVNNNNNNCNDQQQQQPNNNNINKKDEKSKRKCKSRLERQNSLDTATQIRGGSSFGGYSKQYQIENTLMRQRSAHVCGRPTFTNNTANISGNPEFNSSNTGVDILHTKAIKRLNKTSKLQRHRSTESHDDYQRAHNRNMLFFGGRQDSIIGHPISHQQQMSTDIISHHHRTTSSNLGSSDMYLANNSYTKSDLVMEQLEHNLNLMHSLLPQTKSMRKDSNSTMSALQLPVSNSTEQQKTRRHSNTGCKTLTIGSNENNSNILLGNGQQSNVRRIKSAALEISCQQPSVSNLSPHPNSVEAIAGQQIKNPQSALLPPPSKCLVRNPHLNLCSKFGSINSQSNDLIKSGGIMEPVYPEETETDEKCSISDGGGSGIIFTTKKTNCETDDNDNNDGINADDDNGDRCHDEADDDATNEKRIEDLVHDDIDGDELEEDDYANVDKDHGSDTKRCSMTESESEIERPRTQSTDSETDNNGSRSPLLNKSRCENNKSNNRIDEIKTQPQQKHQNFSSNNLIKSGSFLNKKLCNNNSNNIKNNGCPSSDCEHMSASSKDMLLEEDQNDVQHQQHDSSNNSGNTNIQNNVNQNINERENRIEIKETGEVSTTAIPRGLDIAQEEADIENLRVKDAKSLGAIPKTVMRRSSELTNCMSAVASNRTQKPKSMSRTSSSASSRSFSAESFSNDIYKTYKDHYLFAGIGSHNNNNNNNNNNGQNGTIAVSGIIGNINQTNNTSLGLPAVGCTSFVSYPRRTFVDSNYRLHNKLRGSRHNHYGHNNECERIRRMEEISANYNYDSDDLQKNCLENTTNSITTTTTTTALSIKSLINEQYSFDNLLASGDQPRRQSTTIGGGGGGSNSGIGINGGGGGGSSSNGPPNILNVGESIYCDFPWHPCSMSTEKPIQPKRFYKYHIKCFGKHELKIAMDRLQLLALFDRDLNWFHVILAVILSATVCFLGAIILQLGFYKDIFAFIFCIVIAGSLYSLLKSVQPDAASPIHGFNKTVAYSRPIYFCLCSGVLIFSNHLANEFATNNNNDDSTIRNKNLQFFGIIFSATEFFRYITDFMSIILLFFPIFFSLGLFPQINTFCMYILEQIDMHIFGGNATCSLLSSILCVLKSIIAVCILYGPAFGGLTEQKGTQHFLFSFFCALLIPIAYHLSRSASDFSHIWAIIKSSLVNTYSDDDDDEATELNNDEQPQREQLHQQDDEKSTNVQHGSSTKEITNPSSLDDIRPKDFKDDIDDDLTSQQSKTIYSTESKLEGIDSGRGGGDAAAGDCCNDDNNKTDEIINNTTIGEGDAGIIGENESTTATLSSAQPVDNLVQSTEQPDPLPKKLQTTVNCRLKNDLVVSTVLSVFILSLHCSTVFTVLQPDLNIVLYSIAGIMGFLLHYIIPQMRKHMPWLCFARPLLKQKEFGQFEVSDAAKIMWFEGAYVYLCFLERNVLYPLIFISAMTADSQNIVQKFGIHFGAAIVSICALKCVRNAYSDPANQYLILVFSVLLFKVDFNFASETFLINYFFISILFKKCCDFLLKLQFIVTYIAPWQITWGSAFHAFAQPFSVPHSAMLFLQAAISAILSTPLNPFLGSAIFLTSYVRPIKFWERDYNTRRIDHSNTRLSSQLERDLGADDNNLNSIFYEHLTRSLQHSLCGDLLLGRWGNVNQGDCFVLASDYLNCLVHIIELGNGLCTFQMRGLEFRGTYCQQREVEAISEGVEDNDACCCCNPGHIPRMLSANAMFSTRWLAWQVVAAQYVLEGYSISENLATATLQVFEFRKVLITYYIKSIIYYVTRNPKLEKWLSSGPIQDALALTLDRQFVDLDIIFNYNLDEDFDFRVLGITRSSFCSIYLGWIQFCYKKRKDSISATTPDQNPPSTKQDKNDSSLKLEQTPPTTTTNDASNQNCSANNNSISNNNTTNYNSKYSNHSQSTSLNPIPFANTPLGNPTENNNECGDYLENRPTTSTYNLRRNNKKIYKRKLKFGEAARGPASTTPQAPTVNSTTNNNNNVIGNSPITKDSPLVSLCLALGLLARRSLATASHSSLSGVEFFLHGLHALFKGDFRITSPRDEWVFADMELLHGVVAPAVKMALKLHQDHFSSPDEYLDPSVLYEAITTHSKDLVISHEADPIWRSAVLRGAPNLLALRHVMEDGSDEYRIIRLTKRFLSFRVIKLNRECVRGLWAGQQQELIYLRNRNPERGSIQNAKQALRNIINSSCDQPIGYPIYVSPLTTSYADTNDQLCQIIGGAITLESIKQMVMDTWRRIRIRCRQGCSSGSGGIDCDTGGTSDAPMVYFSPITGANTTGTLSYGSQSLSGTGTRGSLASMNKPNSSTLLAGFLNRERDQERDFIREGRTNRKNHSQSLRNDRDRRATLPIASSTMSGGDSRDLMMKDSMQSTSNDLQKLEYSIGYDCAGGINGSLSANLVDPNTKSLGIDGNVSSVLDNYIPEFINSTITEDPKNCKSPNHGVDSEASGIDKNEHQNTSNFNRRSSLFELNRKVIIVDGLEIYDCLDLGRRIDVVWPNEKMRANGGRSSWEDWVPKEGMVGYIRHFWQPNHPDKRFRSNVNRTVYLIEIGERFVPVSENGIREYNQILNEPNNSSTITTPSTNTNLPPNISINIGNISTANIPITSNLKRSSIYLNNNNNIGVSSNLHKSLREYPSSSTFNESKNIPFTNTVTDLDDASTTVISSSANTITSSSAIPISITKMENSNQNTSHLNNKNKKCIFTDIHDVEATVAEIFENLSNNSTESEDTNGTDFSSRTISENSNSISIDDNILKEERT